MTEHATPSPSRQDDTIYDAKRWSTNDILDAWEAAWPESDLYDRATLVTVLEEIAEEQVKS